MYNFRWNNRDAWPYIGEDRKGSSKSLAMRLRVGGRLRWTISRQAWAVSQGFFVQRCNDFIPRENQAGMERAIIHALSDRVGHTSTEPKLTLAQKNLGWHHISYYDPRRTIFTIKKWCKLGDPDYLYLRDFIKQQDEYGYFGAWDRRVEQCSETLSWYRHYLDATNDGSRSGYLAFNGRGGDMAGDIDIEDAQHDLRVIEHRRRLRLSELRDLWEKGKLPLTRAEQRRNAALGSPFAKMSDILDPPVVDRLARQKELDDECSRLAQERIARRGW